MWLVFPDVEGKEQLAVWFPAAGPNIGARPGEKGDEKPDKRPEEPLHAVNCRSNRIATQIGDQRRGTYFPPRQAWASLPLQTYFFTQDQ